MKLMMSEGKVVTEDGEIVENVYSVTLDQNSHEAPSMTIEFLGGPVIYKGDVKPLKADLEPKLKTDDHIELKIISDGWGDPGTKVVDVNTGRSVGGIQSVSFEVVAGEILPTATIRFNHLKVDAGLLPKDVRFDFDEAIKMDRRERNLFNRFVRFPIEIKWYSVKRLFKKLW